MLNYLKIKGKKLREAIIENGIYELRKQVEDTHTGMKPVVDWGVNNEN